MRKKYLDQLPSWYKENCECDLVMSDDIDALVSASLLKREKGWNVKYFYDFDNFYKSDFDKMHTRVWCDIAILKNGERAFDNHVSRTDRSDMVNKNCINPNLLNNVTAMNYKRKYAGSTALLIWSIYGIPLPKTEKGKMLLLCIDSAFKGYYTKKFHYMCKFYLRDMFGFEELIDVLKRHTAEEFYQMIDEYHLTKKIVLSKKGYLCTDLDLNLIGELLELDVQLPNIQFHKAKELERRSGKIGTKRIKDLTAKIFTLAYIYSDKVVCSVVPA